MGRNLIREIFLFQYMSEEQKEELTKAEKSKRYYQQRKERDPEYLVKKRAKAKEYYQKKKMIRDGVIEKQIEEEIEEPIPKHSYLTQEQIDQLIDDDDTIEQFGDLVDTTDRGMSGSEIIGLMACIDKVLKDIAIEQADKAGSECKLSSSPVEKPKKQRKIKKQVTIAEEPTPEVADVGDIVSSDSQPIIVEDSKTVVVKQDVKRKRKGTKKVEE